MLLIIRNLNLIQVPREDNLFCLGSPSVEGHCLDLFFKSRMHLLHRDIKPAMETNHVKVRFTLLETTLRRSNYSRRK